MSKWLNNVVISVALGMSPLSSATEVDNNCMNNSKMELSQALQINNINESFEIVNPNIVVSAVLRYFDEDVKKFKLSPKARNEIKCVLDSYFTFHSFFVVDNSGKLEFYIDDKKEFSKMIKGVINIVIEDIPFLVKKVVIPLFL